MSNASRLLLAIAISAPLLSFAGTEDTNDGSRAPIPVIVELFTSEGCSSCPPADALLAKLDRSQIGGGLVIALEEHVDYWNQLGWPDRFSAPIFRIRQNEYARTFRTENIYTPQMIVGGRAEFVGDDSSRASHEISRAAVPPSYGLRLSPERSATDPALIELTVYVKMLREKPQAADVYLAVTESKLSSDVKRGENAGRLLKHAPVVRSFGVIGSIEPRRFDEVGIKSTMKLPEEWRRENLRAVVFVQDRNTHAITAAATIDLK